jgi:methionyl-tRNA formyltransferase
LNQVFRSLALAFAGTPEFALPALDELAGSRHRLTAVFTQPDRPAGRGRELQQSAVKRRALELGLPVHQPASLKSPEALALLRSLVVDAWVVVAYGLILPPATLAVPPLGCFNIHASLLPRWRGAAPIQRAILAGDAVTGVSIMRMEAGLDTGPVLAVQPVDILASDTAGTLHDRLAALGGRMIVDAMDALAAGTSVASLQSADATYAAKIDKAEAHIDWQDDAAAVARKVRAFNPWPVAETRLNGVQLRLWEAQVQAAQCAPDARAGEVLHAGPQGIEVACGRGSLRITRLQLAGRKALAAAEFLKAQPLTGVRFGGA